MATTSNRIRYQRRRDAPPPANNSVRRAYDLLRSTLANLEPDSALIESDLVESLSASRNTVRLVLQLLAAEGLVCRGPKVGTHVGSSVVIRLDQLIPTEELLDKRPMSLCLRETSIIPAPMLVAERLELAPGSLVRVTEGLMVDGVTPIALLVSYVGLPSDAGRQFNPADTAPDTITFLEEQLDVAVVRADTAVVALACDAQTATLLEIPQGSPILFIEDLLRDADDRPRALSHFRFRSDGVMLSMTAWRHEPSPTDPA
jgi:GntR family transcriptional regulator